MYRTAIIIALLMLFGVAALADDLDSLRVRAGQGDVEAQFVLGYLHETGNGVPQDYAESFKWYLQAAEQGFVAAQARLGLCYELGQGVAQDYAESFKWYRQAAEQGNATAQLSLGLLYKSGQGVRLDYAEAHKWIKRAAEQGGALPQLTLGFIYLSGEGTPQDHVEAHKWFNLAAAKTASSSGSREREASGIAREARDEIARQMTPAQIAEAQKLAREWRPTPTN